MTVWTPALDLTDWARLTAYLSAGTCPDAYYPLSDRPGPYPPWMAATREVYPYGVAALVGGPAVFGGRPGVAWGYLAGVAAGLYIGHTPAPAPTPAEDAP